MNDIKNINTVAASDATGSSSRKSGAASPADAATLQQLEEFLQLFADPDQKENLSDALNNAAAFTAQFENALKKSESDQSKVQNDVGNSDVSDLESMSATPSLGEMGLISGNITASSDAQKQLEAILQGLIETLKNVIGKKLVSDPAGAQKDVQEIANRLLEITKQDPRAIGNVLIAVGPQLAAVLAANPGREMDALKVLSPLMKESGQKAMDGIIDAQAGLARLANTKPTEQDLASMASFFSSVTAASSSQEALYQQMMPLLQSFSAADHDKFVVALKDINDILAMMAARNPEKAKEMLQNFLDVKLFEKAFALNTSDMTAVLGSVSSVLREIASGNKDVNGLIDNLNLVLNERLKPAQGGGGGGGIPPINQTILNYAQNTTNNSPNLSDMMGLAMLFLQQFEQAIAKSQADQDKCTIAIGQITVQASLDMQTKINEKLKELEEARDKASHQSWWQTLISVIVAVVAAAVAALTCGLGAAIAAVLVGAFMASPLMKMTITAIADKIASDLKGKYYDQYIKEGMTPQEAEQKAEEKANAIANVIASVVVIIAVAVVSLGAGGLESFSEGGTQVVEEETAATAEDAASAGSKLGWTGSQAAKVAAFQSLSTIASTNLPMQIMMTDPEWVKSHEDLAAGLDAMALFVLVIASAFAGFKAMGGSEGAQTLFNSMQGLAKGLCLFNGAAQMGAGSYGAYTAFKQAGYMEDQANFTKELASLQKASIEAQGAQAINSKTEDTINDTAETIQKAIAELENQIQASSGKDFDAVNSVIGR